MLWHPNVHVHFYIWCAFSWNSCIALLVGQTFFFSSVSYAWSPPSTPRLTPRPPISFYLFIRWLLGQVQQHILTWRLLFPFCFVLFFSFPIIRSQQRSNIVTFIDYFCHRRAVINLCVCVCVPSSFFALLLLLADDSNPRAKYLVCMQNHEWKSCQMGINIVELLVFSRGTSSPSFPFGHHAANGSHTNHKIWKHVRACTANMVVDYGKQRPRRRR